MLKDVKGVNINLNYPFPLTPFLYGVVGDFFISADVERQIRFGKICRFTAENSFPWILWVFHERVPVIC